MPRGVPSSRESARAPFLTAEWRYLAMVNYEVSPPLVEPLVPRGTDLDDFNGRLFISLVGFRFLNTRVRGWAIPGHRDFDEVNLRFYVRRQIGDERRRAVTFIREVVPRRAVAAAARLLYNEPYVAMPMRSEIRLDETDHPARVRYGWRSPAGWHALEVGRLDEPSAPPPESEGAFVAEHYWGYTRQRDGGTIEYRVEHPPWRLGAASTFQVSGDMSSMYGDAFGEVLAREPASAFLAEGSAVTVSRPVRV